jgi:hypothetical protein
MAIDSVDDKVARPLTDAVTTSFAPQPLSLYEAVATPPAPVVTVLVSTALLLPAQGEVKVTVCGAVTGMPLLLTVTLTLVVPNAERGLMPKMKLVMLTLAAPMEKPSEPLTALVPTWLVAVTVDAPEAARLAAFSVTVAVPVESVSAVPEAGTIAAKAVFVVNVTTVLGTPLPPGSLTSARAIAGTAVVVAPVVGSASVITRLA